MALRQFLDAVGTVELAPFGAQVCDRVLLAPNIAAKLRDFLGLQGRLVFDLVDVGCREHERGQHHDMQQAPEHQRPLMASASDGRRGRRCERSPPMGAAAVRSPARSLAERERGLAAISRSSATSGLRVRISKLGGACATSGWWREPATMRPRSARKVFTMRSSSEKNEITAR